MCNISNLQVTNHITAADSSWLANLNLHRDNSTLVDLRAKDQTEAAACHWRTIGTGECIKTSNSVSLSKLATREAVAAVAAAAASPTGTTITTTTSIRLRRTTIIVGAALPGVSSRLAVVITIAMDITITSIVRIPAIRRL